MVSLKQLSLNFLESRKNKKNSKQAAGSPPHGKAITRHYSMDNIMLGVGGSSGGGGRGGKHPGFNKRNSLVIHHASHVDLSSMPEVDENDAGIAIAAVTRRHRRQSRDPDVCDSIGSLGTSCAEEEFGRVDSVSSFASDCREQNHRGFFIGESDGEAPDTCMSLDTAERRYDVTLSTAETLAVPTAAKCSTKIPTGTNMLDNFMWKDVIVYNNSPDQRHSSVDSNSNMARSPCARSDCDVDASCWQQSPPLYEHPSEHLHEHPFEHLHEHLPEHPSEHLPSLDSGISMQPFMQDLTFHYMTPDPHATRDPLSPILDSPEFDSEVRHNGKHATHSTTCRYVHTKSVYLFF